MPVILGSESGKIRAFSVKGINRNSPKMSLLSWGILAITFILLFAGIVFIFDASIYQAVTVFHDKFHFVVRQLVWVALGSLAILVISRIDYRKFTKGKFMVVLLSGMIVSLVAVLFLSEYIGGSRRWFVIPGVGTIQPAEFAKLGIIIYLASWLSKPKPTVKSFKEALQRHFLYDLLGFLAIAGGIGLLILIEPDMGTTMIVLATSFIIFFVSGKDIVHMMGSISVVIILLLLMVVAGIVAPYRLKRINTFLEVFKTGIVSEEEMHGSGYQIQRILIGIGNGGAKGVGLGNSMQEHGFLVENTAFTDSIIAVILEEVGFWNGILFMGLYVAFAVFATMIALKTVDPIGRLIALGIGAWILLQALLHFATNLVVIPLTGLPLPFVTYGGSSILIVMIAVGLLLSIDRHGETVN
ncbi:FtsW/RodA/SpoVE family cell cycle protein [Candidatus Dojkabacteria bacterium]|nr:FtsW/RodA/SpoVE family cell cycle protein [Candidatus Dojkabacteria bacterium]